MRNFLTGCVRPVQVIFLVESGSRGILERAIAPIRRNWVEEVWVDLVTCYGGLPAGFSPERTRVYRVTECRSPQARRSLYRQVVKNRYAMVGIVCSGEPLLTKWKWALALRFPTKVLIITKNGDYFPLDLGHWRNVYRFVLSRSGLGEVGAVRRLALLISFPFTLLYLLLYATTVHARRALRRG